MRIECVERLGERDAVVSARHRRITRIENVGLRRIGSLRREAGGGRRAGTVAAAATDDVDCAGRGGTNAHGLQQAAARDAALGVSIPVGRRHEGLLLYEKDRRTLPLSGWKEC